MSFLVREKECVKVLTEKHAWFAQDEKKKGGKKEEKKKGEKEEGPVREVKAGTGDGVTMKGFKFYSE